MIELTHGEIAALRTILDYAVAQYKKENGSNEDIIGVFLTTGAAKCLEGDESSVLSLINKLKKIDDKEVV